MISAERGSEMISAERGSEMISAERGSGLTEMVSRFMEMYKEQKCLEALSKVAYKDRLFSKRKSRRPVALPSRANISRIAARQRSGLPYPRDRPI